jgi:hypothetical protein
MHQICDQIIRQRYVHDCLYKEIAIPPHLLDLEKFAIPKKHVFFLVSATLPFPNAVLVYCTICIGLLC